MCIQHTILFDTLRTRAAIHSSFDVMYTAAGGNPPVHPGMRQYGTVS